MYKYVIGFLLEYYVYKQVFFSATYRYRFVESFKHAHNLLFYAKYFFHQDGPFCQSCEPI